MATVAYQGPTLIHSGTSTTTGSTYEINRKVNGPAERTFHAKGTTSSGAGAASIVVQVSNFESSVDADWITLGTISLTLGTTSTGDGFASSAGWTYVRGKIASISGTGASVQLVMGY